jgi:hypothetical protein
MASYPDYFGVITSAYAYGVWSGIKEGRYWAMDNSAFTKDFNSEKFFRALDAHAPYASTCLFVVMPDKVADAEATLSLYWQYRKQYRSYPFPVAFVAQDGIRV